MRFCATEGSPCSIVSCRFCTLSSGGSDGVAAVIRDSLLYAVTWQARKGRLEIPGSRHEASSYNSTRMRASSRIENYHNDIHICRRIAGILGRSFYCPESWISRDLEGDRETVSDLVLANVYGVAFILQVIARLQVTRGFINCLDVISPQRLHVAAVSLCFSIPIFNISHFYTYVWESFRHKLKISVVIGKINMQIMPRHCVLPL